MPDRQFDGLDVVVQFGSECLVTMVRAAVLGGQLPSELAVRPHHEPFSLSMQGARSTAPDRWSLAATSCLDRSHGRRAQRLEDAVQVVMHHRVDGEVLHWERFGLDEASATLMRMRGLNGSTPNLDVQVNDWLGDWAIAIDTGLPLELLAAGVGCRMPTGSRIRSAAPRAASGASLAVGHSALRRWVAGLETLDGSATKGLKSAAVASGVRVSWKGATADLSWGQQAALPVEVVGDASWCADLQRQLHEALARAGWALSRRAWKIPVASMPADSLHDECWDVVARLGEPVREEAGCSWSLTTRIGRRRRPRDATLVGWDDVGGQVQSVSVKTDRGEAVLGRAAALQAQETGRLARFEVPEVLPDGTKVPRSVRRDLSEAGLSV